jgi:hypothetical protein
MVCYVTGTRGWGVDGQGCGCEVGVVRVLVEVAGRVFVVDAVRWHFCVGVDVGDAG